MKTANENVIKALARLMVMARAGQIEAIGVIAATPDGVPDISYGGETELIPTINIGLDSLKAELVDQIRGQRVQQPVAMLRRATGALDG
jgi:hypothetical protein